MASCQTSQWVANAPVVKLDVSESSSTGNTSTLSWKLLYISSYPADTNINKDYTVILDGSTVKTGKFSIDGKTGTHTIASGTKTINKTTSAKTINFSISFAFNITWSGVYGGTKTASGSISVPAKTSYSVKYNANGGSGAPSAQTKWHGTSLKLSSTKPTRTGYTFQGWAKSENGAVSYAAGADYTSNAAVTLYAVWKVITYTITYNANGGSGGPTKSIKTHGVTLALSTIKPTKANYAFKGWSNTPTGSVIYSSGGNYVANANVTLYAVWALAYKKPRVRFTSCFRCDDDGNPEEYSSSAQYTFTWSTDLDVTDILFWWKTESETSWKEHRYSASGKSGTITDMFNGSLDPEVTYTLCVRVQDSQDYADVYYTLPGGTFVIDRLVGGRGIAIGKPAEMNNYFDCAHYAMFRRNAVSQHTDVAFIHKHGTSGAEIAFGVGAGGSNRGIFDLTLNKWIFRTDGTDTYIASAGGEFRPYYKPGDTLTTRLRTSGYCTNAATEIWFEVSIPKPLLNVKSASAASVGGLIIRNWNNYTHGSSASSRVFPSNYTCFIDDNAIFVRAVMSSTENATNNSSLGIDADISITFA